jgi:hypothetical protein
MESAMETGYDRTGHCENCGKYVDPQNSMNRAKYNLLYENKEKEKK